MRKRDRLCGWVGEILRINLDTGKTSIARTLEYGKRFIGGRGINARIAWEELSPDVGAFDSRNMLMFMTGPLTGTLASGSGRIEIGGIAPARYPVPRYSRSSIGGRWGPELKYAGYDGIVVQGKAEKPVYLWINDGHVEIRSAKDLWGLDTFSTIKWLMNEHGSEVKVLCIGPAGERLVRIATIQSDTKNAAGQGGFGAVMGSKNLKAIVVRGTGGVRIASPEKFMKACLSVGNEMCWPQEIPVKPPTGPHIHIQACTTACRAHCVARYRKKLPGVTDGALNSGLDLCNQIPTGTMEGEFEVKTAFQKYGVNTWEVAYSIVPWLELCRKEGLIADIDGVPIPEIDCPAPFWKPTTHFKPTEGPEAPPLFWLTVVRKIAYREGIGDVLSEGTCRAADELFQGNGRHFISRMYPGAPDCPIGYIAHTGGRWDTGNTCRFPYWLVTALLWAIDTRDPVSDSAHHYLSNIHSWPKEYGGRLSWDKVLAISRRIYGTEDAFDPNVSYDPPESKAIPAIWHGNRGCILSSLLLCDWNFPRIFSIQTEDGYWDTSLESKLFSTATGIDMSESDLDRAGERIFNLERMIEVRYGRSREDDEKVIPYFEQPDKDGIKLDRGGFMKVMDEYYRLRGWDVETGRPTTGKLGELGLEN